MITHVKFVSIPTRDQDRALAFYTEKLGFKVLTDQPYDDTQRWIELRVGTSDTRVVLFKMGDQAAGGPFHGALACDNVERTYQELTSRGVEFVSPPKEQFYGVEAVLKDPFGNWFSLTQPK